MSVPDQQQPDERPCGQMWINAFSLVRPSDDLLRDIGRDVVELVKASMSRERSDPLDPMVAS